MWIWNTLSSPEASVGQWLSQQNYCLHLQPLQRSKKWTHGFMNLWALHIQCMKHASAHADWIMFGLALAERSTTTSSITIPLWEGEGCIHTAGVTVIAKDAVASGEWFRRSFMAGPWSPPVVVHTECILCLCSEQAPHWNTARWYADDTPLQPKISAQRPRLLNILLLHCSVLTPQPL